MKGRGRPLRWRPRALPADRITASMRLRAVKIAALEAENAAHAKMLRDLRALLPFAARRLPDEVLDCFDEQQRLIRPYPRPEPVRRPAGPPGPPMPRIPIQRRASPGRVIRTAPGAETTQPIRPRRHHS